MSLNYYDILEISPDADKDKIRAAYRKKAKKFHPDINKDAYAEIKFKEINLAAQTLLDDKLRAQYDFAFGFNPKTTCKGNPEVARETYKRASYEYKKQTQKQEFKFGEFFSKKEKKTEPKKIDGEDITTTVTITKKEALCGTIRKVNILETEKCPKCFGAKFVNGGKCAFCDGVGEKNTYKKISVKIPPNIKNGAKIRVKGQGSKGKFGGADGNLYLIVNIDETSKFELKGGIVNIEIPITPFEAALGADIKVPTPRGDMKLKIPENTHSNTIFRLYDCGIEDPKTKKFGMVLVRVIIEMPTKLTDEEKELYRALKKVCNSNIREEFYKKYD